MLAAGEMLGCDQGCSWGPSSQPPTEPPKPPRRPVNLDAGVAALLGIDADVPPTDPPAPPGDLKAEVDAFTTLEACVGSRAPLDSVVGDAIDAIGYDSLLHDACRVLQAVKARNPAACDPIVSSSLRAHCVASVAIVAADEGMCPMELEGHDPLCVALARRDSRLCTTVSREDRATCRAVLAHDTKLCEGDRRCARLVSRWGGLVSDAAQGPELGTRVVMTLAGAADAGAGGKPMTFDLSKDTGPATVRQGPTGTKILIGETATAAWPPAMIAPEARMSVVLSADGSTIKQGKHAVERDAVSFVLLVPKVATLSSESMDGAATLDVDLVGLKIGAPVRFTLTAKMPEEIGGYRVRIEVNTFVRDVVTVGK